MRLLAILLFSILSITNAHAQTEILEMDVPEDSVMDNFGENRRHYVHTFWNVGLMTSVTDNSGNYNFPRSHHIAFGALYKLRITHWLAMGAEIKFDNLNYRVDRDRQTVFPDTTFHSKEKVMQNLLSGSYFIRLNLDDRGNTIGKFVDIGIGGGLQLGSQYRYEDELDNNEIREVRIRNYQPTTANEWHIYGRLGVNNISLYARYRMNDLFEKTIEFPTAPKFTIGLMLGLH